MKVGAQRGGERSRAALQELAKLLLEGIETSGPRPYFLGQLWPFVLAERF
jgi:hypothetical protein